MSRIALISILRNCETTAGRMLESVLPFVDGAVIGFAGPSDDKTEIVVAGALTREKQRVAPYDFATMPEEDLPRYDTGRIIKPFTYTTLRFPWEDDFSAARNKVTQHAFENERYDWIVWLDGDDELQAGYLLDQLVDIGGKNNDIDAFEAIYHYRQDQHGNWYDDHVRERVIRREAWERGARWRYRVHEHFRYPGKQKLIAAHVRAAGATEFEVFHRADPLTRDISYPIRVSTKLTPEELEKNPPRQISKTDIRNLRLLRLSLHDPVPPDDYRAYQELGRFWRFHNRATLKRAIPFYRHMIEWFNPGPEERYIALHHLADVYRETGGITEAVRLDLEATQLRPDWMDAWVGLAEAALKSGRPERCLQYLDHALKSSGTVDALIGYQLTDYTFQPYLIKAQAEYALGYYHDAQDSINQALSVIPDNPECLQVKKVIDEKLSEEQAFTLVEAAITTFPHLYPDLPARMKTRKSVRDPFFAGVAEQIQEKADIQIVCGPAMEDWGPDSLHGGGIGGSETAVIHFAAWAAAKLHKQVVVWNTPGAEEGIDPKTGVAWLDFTRMNLDTPVPTTIVWRKPAVSLHLPKETRKIFWAHDLNYGRYPEGMDRYDRVVAVSRWHRDYLSQLYPFLTKEQLTFAPNGVDGTLFGKDWRAIKRNPHKYVWLSSPDRGLGTLLELWPEIVQSIDPKAELHIFYGFNNLEKIAQHDRQYALYLMGLLQQIRNAPNVNLRGRVGQAELAQELMTSHAWLYPTHFVETSCISAMEAQMAGCIPVVSDHGALSQTVSAYGVRVPGLNVSAIYKRRFLTAIADLIRHPEDTERRRMSMNAFAAQEYTWPKSLNHWRQILK